MIWSDHGGEAEEGTRLLQVPQQAAGSTALQALCVPGIGDACIPGRLKKELSSKCDWGDCWYYCPGGPYWSDRSCRKCTCDCFPDHDCRGV